MSDYEQLKEIYKDYHKIYDIKAEIKKIELQKKEIKYPNLLPETEAKKERDIKLYLGMKIIYILIYALSVLVFFFVVEPYLFPVLSEEISWFSEYVRLPNIGPERSIYIGFYIGALIVPLLLAWPILPEEGGLHSVAILLMSPVLAVLALVSFIILKLLTTFYLIDPYNQGVIEFISALESYSFIATIHIFVIGLYSSVIGLIVYHKRYNRLRYLMGNSRLDKIKEENQKRKEDYKINVDYFDASIGLYKLKLKDLNLILKKHPMYKVLNSEPAGFDQIMTYFSQRRIVSVEEANTLYKIEKDLESSFNKLEDTYLRRSKDLDNRHKTNMDRYDSALKDLETEYDRKNEYLERKIYEQEVMAERAKYGD